MKRIAITAGVALLLTAGGANAADIYNQGGSTKDGPHTPDTRGGNHTGWSARAFIGYAMGERDIRSEANAFLNCTNVYNLPVNTEEDPTAREDAIAALEEQVAEANANGVFASLATTETTANLVLPILGALFNNSDGDDFNSFVFGGGVEYLHQMGQFGLGLGVDVTAYADAESKTEFANVPTFFARGTLTNPANGEDNDFEGPTGLTVSGYASVDRQIDIDLVGKLYFFPSHDLAFFGKAGPSFAKAKVKGGVFIDGGGADDSLEYENDDWSIGYVVGVGVTKWWSKDWSSTLEGDWKAHSFNADGKKSVDLGDSHCCDQISLDAAGRTEVDDNVWTVKLDTKYHF